MDTNSPKLSQAQYHSQSQSQSEPEISEWDRASYFSKFTFSIVNPLLAIGLTRQLNFEDLLLLPRADESSQLISKLQSNYTQSRSIPSLGIPRLLIALVTTVKDQFIIVGIYYILEGVMRIFCTILLGLFLKSLEDSQSSIRESLILAMILSCCNLIQNLIHHVSFYYSMKMGNNMKIATIGFIYNRLFQIQGNILQTSGISAGQLVNLISNDVQRYEDWSLFCQYIWESLLEVGLIFIALSFQLNLLSALAGIGLIFATLPLQFHIAKLFSLMRGDTARQTDQRVRHMSEIIDGISSVKAYGWEQPFISLILSIRNLELLNALRSQKLRAINYCLYYCSPHITLFAIFVVYFQQGGRLTLPLVYTTMSFVQTLRLNIGRFFTRAVETYSEAQASSYRIEKYLDLFHEESDGDKREERRGRDKREGQGQRQEGEERGINNSNITKLIEVKNGNFAYSSTALPVLTNINFSLKKGELLMVIGSVGAGKSSLLNSLLGDTISVPSPTSQGDIHSSTIIWNEGNGTQPSVAYCTQRPWIVATTVKANITMAGKIDGPCETTSVHDATSAGPVTLEGDIELVDPNSSNKPNNSSYGNFKNPQFIDESLYKLAIETCRLAADLDQWPDDDMTEIGERGVSVSGGQKARIALARAVYSDADVYFLDDPLSAVDAHVGKDLFFECILNTLKIQKNKGVILVTHQLQNMRYADKILVLNTTGDQVFYGTFQELVTRRAEFPFLEIDSGELMGEDSITKMRCESDGSISSLTAPIEESRDPLIQDSSNGSHPLPSSPKESLMTPPPTHALPSSPSFSPPAPLLSARSKSFIITTEDRAVGSVTSSTYLQYLLSGGICLGSSALLYAIFGQILSMITDYWLRWWASETFGPQDQIMYQWIFAILVGLTILVGYHKVEIWFYFTTIASKELHLQSLWGVLHSPLRFFISNPTGRILNRFTKDQNQVDELFPSTFFDCFQCILFCLSGLTLVCISVPWLLLLMVGVAYFFIYYRRLYIQSSLEIKRIEAITRSPIYADFSATLDGLNTLRAYQLEDRFISSFYQLLNNNARVYYSFLITSRWLGVRLDWISSMVLVVLLFVSCGLRQQVDVGLLGFALVYTMNLASLFQWTVRQSAEVENQMTSVERIRSYGLLPPEEGYDATIDELKQSQHHHNNHQHDKKKYSPVPPQPEGDIENQQTPHDLHDPMNQQSLISLSPSAIPSSSTTQHLVGRVELKSLTVTYRPDLPPVLKDLSIDIPPGHKVGICGRTGSGKSSLLQALLRLNIITSGDILVDGISLLSMSLEDSRGLISLIPQDPHLFSGTVRFNIDPFLQHTDEEIWHALQDAQLFEYIKSFEKSTHLSSGLDLIVEEGGRNFSVGQRQLLSLARAIVRKGKVILMDEVTASIDYLTDKAIQDTIRTSSILSSATIITVAHRLRTIADSDLIGFIEEGRFVEIGQPYELLRRRSSHYRKLAEESNEFEEIKGIAKKKYEKKYLELQQSQPPQSMSIELVEEEEEEGGC